MAHPLKVARMTKLMSQKELADASGVSAASICQIELGRYRGAFPTLKALARVLDIEWHTLVVDDEAEA